MWIDTIDAVESDPELRGRFQFWAFGYPTGDPISISALQLRESLSSGHHSPRVRYGSLRALRRESNSWMIRQIIRSMSSPLMRLRREKSWRPSAWSCSASIKDGRNANASASRASARCAGAARERTAAIGVLHPLVQSEFAKGGR